MNQPPDSIQTKTCQRPWLAALFSLLLPGLGQIYCRQDNKGVFLAGMALLGQWSSGGLSSWILCPAMALDAWMIARTLRQTGGIERWDFFPGFRPLNSIPTRVMLMTIVLLVAALTAVHIRQFASDYALPGK